LLHVGPVETSYMQSSPGNIDSAVCYGTKRVLVYWLAIKKLLTYSWQNHRDTHKSLIIT